LNARHVGAVVGKYMHHPIRSENSVHLICDLHVGHVITARECPQFLHREPFKVMSSDQFFSHRLLREPCIEREQLTAVQDMLGQGTGVSDIARSTGLSRQTIYRIKSDSVAAETSLAQWANSASCQ
jgi:DNA-binding phage protein